MDGGLMAADEAGRLLAAQRRAAARQGVPDHAARIAALGRLEAVLRARAEPMAAAISADFGNRARPETMLAELVPALGAIRHVRRNLARWMRPQRRRVDMAFRPGRAWVEMHPLGCIGIVSPWNYPLLLTVSPLVDALAAGNRVLVKPSEVTPGFAAQLAAALAEAFDPAQLAVMQGGPEVAQAFCALPFDHLLFTGSTVLGREVARAAAENLTPVTLELGGKSPVIVCPDHDMAAAAATVAVGKFFNAGQTCLAPDYALVPVGQAEAFAQAVMARAKRMYPRIAGNPDYTSIVSDRHLARLRSALAEAEAGGARVLRHEDAPEERRLGPAVVLDAPADGALMRDEIFGPILPVVPYATLDDAIGYVNARPRPLALYPFTRDPATARRVLDATVSGGVTWNGTILHCAQDDLPFGGIGASGMGAYHGRDGFLRFSHQRAIYRPGRFSGFTALTPPHGWRTRALMRLMLRR